MEELHRKKKELEEQRSKYDAPSSLSGSGIGATAISATAPIISPPSTMSTPSSISPPTAVSPSEYPLPSGPDVYSMDNYNIYDNYIPKQPIADRTLKPSVTRSVKFFN